MKALSIFGIIAMASSCASAGIAYGITDAGQSGSQLVTWDLGDGSVSNLANGLYDGYDLEASDISSSMEWFIIGGGNGSVADQVFRASLVDGSMVSLGSLSFGTPTNGNNEVVSASFNDATGRLWVYRQNDGFYSFDTGNLGGMVEEIDMGGNIEAMAWDSSGTNMYYFDQASFYSWNAVDGVQLLDASLIAGGVESLEFDADGNLIAGIETSNTEFSLLEIDLGTLGLTNIGTYIAPSGDMESLSFVPTPGTAVLLGLGGMVGIRRRR